ncbi:fluoride efflux transporter CrcB [Ectobacillus ponti]|uniref:Fluoride-specific ion channel FluC n=1 Tax=Ectobacillus ponti TaxID=2961894 RepID=A0AA41X1P7_9BACI|nr:fluoride efflux transporter CrcB [Ectobacillus ponti]MCP8966977.1 fluoride efflux transporter CrcB [Ectobacillus ponti]
MTALLVAAGGFCGAIVRFWISSVWKARYRGSFPFATLFINVTGAFLLGLLWGARAGEEVLLLCGTGFMGAYTTFSTMKLETVQLLQQKRLLSFGLYLLVTYCLGIALAFLGYETGALL